MGIVAKWKIKQKPLKLNNNKKTKVMGNGFTRNRDELCGKMVKYL